MEVIVPKINEDYLFYLLQTIYFDNIEDVTDKIFCNIQGVLDSLLQVIGQVTSALDSLEDAKEMMDAWKGGEKIFSDATNLFEMEEISLSGLFSFFMNLMDG